MSATTEQMVESGVRPPATNDGWRHGSDRLWRPANDTAVARGASGDISRAAPAARSHQGSNSSSLNLLVRTVEAEVLPRLILARRAALAAPPVEPGVVLAATDVAELVTLVLGQEASAACAFVESLRQRQVTLDSVYLHLLTPAARELGEMWNEDRVDFTQVTVGLMRLQQVLRAINPAFLETVPYGARGARVLLVPAPGEQHTFGLVMVAEFFRRAGWAVSGGPDSKGVDPVALVRTLPYAMIGISIGSTTRLDGVARQIRAVRRASCNRSIGVMVGGPLLLAHPEIVSMVGADATASDGAQAVAQAEGLLALLR
jgi:methanogenic corrinoid protein MtbC1